MMQKIRLEHVLFLDIETVPQVSEYNKLDQETKELFALKTAYQRKEDYTAEEFYDKAGIWAEFGKIICISVGYFVIKGDIRNFRIRSFHGDEKKILLDFAELLNEHFSAPYHLLCGHNAKEFDFPYIGRRMIINGISLPEKLNLFGKKPWEINHLDTMDMWKLGDYKHYTSIRLLTHVLQIPSPKEDMDGSEVYKAFYQEDRYDDIIRYCEKDVIACAQIVLRFRQEELLIPEEISVV